MTGIYFSGTGNTRYCVKRFVSAAEKGAKCFSIEDAGATDEISRHETVVFGFPVYYSNIPKIVKDFIYDNASVFRDKKIFIITTKGFFNAYGAGYAARLFKDRGAEFIGSLQLNMPDNIRDMLIMEIVFSKNYKKIIDKADRKIIRAVNKFKENKPVKSGLSAFNIIIGGFLKVLWFYPKTDKYIKAPKVNNERCNGCGKCATLCPMKNIKIVCDKAVSSDKCTVCYRCFNNCPARALTILGSKAYNQYTLYDSGNEEK